LRKIIMNATLTTAAGRHDHPPEPPAELREQPRRVGTLDRLALHLGLALIKWGRRRSRPTESREELVRRFQERQACAERERGYERTRLLMFPLR
jgi:hypothetical protein